ncbi:MAG: carbohydrate-binding family 9-like protein [Acidobacteria bacterium]|nr:carbohydrate-binding family 9-like protein [Acidobacteriota bacterium]
MNRTCFRLATNLAAVVMVLTWVGATEPLPPTVARNPLAFTPPRGYVCHRVPAPLTVDGRLDELSWSLALWSAPHVDIEGPLAAEPRHQTRVKMLWDNRYLYVGALLEDPHVWGTLTERNSVIFHDNDFEVFIDPDGDGHAYYEFEMNALNTVWNLFLDKPYKNGGIPVVREMPDQRSGVWVCGSLNDPKDTDHCWTVEIAFPWAVMAEYAGGACPPRDGDQWRISFSRVEWGFTIEDGRYRRVPWPGGRAGGSEEANWVWTPQGVINMHRPETWGYVQFSSLPAGRSVPLRPDETAAVRYLLYQVHYAQQEFHRRHGRYARDLTELPDVRLTAAGLAGPVTMRTEDAAFIVTALVRRADGRLVRLTVDDTARCLQRAEEPSP